MAAGLGACGSQIEIGHATPTTAGPYPTGPAADHDDRAPADGGAPADVGASLSQPAPAPAEAYYDESLETIGHLSIPRLGLETPVYQGLSLSIIDHGPSHWPGTALPGHLGNVTIAGHRVTHSRPFRNMDQLQPRRHGDVHDGRRHVRLRILRNRDRSRPTGPTSPPNGWRIRQRCSRVIPRARPANGS
jgi:hypothetical protein